ncbi:MAG: hypothetical protein P9M15_06970 [Candidatus Electryoneaceae bacterium]|nr:hypothetical protein [Candidatus Electryoneaceae bacterium]
MCRHTPSRDGELADEHVEPDHPVRNVACTQELRCQTGTSNTTKLIRLTTCILAIMVLLMPLSLLAQDLSGIPGAFADVGMGLRPLGMGGAYSTLATDENAARWNPSLLGAVRDPVVGFTWANQLSQISYHYAAFSVPIGRKGIGCGGYLISAGDDIYRETTIALAAGVDAQKIKVPVEGLHLGMTVKVRTVSFGDGGDDFIPGDNYPGDISQERVSGSAAGFGVDIGTHYQVSEEVSLAVVMRDLVNTLSWDSSVRGTYDENVPFRLVFAGSMELEHLTMAFEYLPSLDEDVNSRMIFGAEVILFRVIKPRIGIAQDMESGEVNRWVTLGVGVDVPFESFGPIKHIHFGYTHMFHHIDHTPRVGLSLSF